MVGKFIVYKRFCNRCGEIFPTKSKGSKVCVGCFLPRGGGKPLGKSSIKRLLGC